MIEAIQNFHPLALAVLAGLFTWAVTALGASMVFFVKDVSPKLLTVMLGFAAGVMIAASFWSLLNPAIELSENLGVPGWLPAVVGFLLGGAFLRLMDKFIPHVHLDKPTEEAEGPHTNWKRSTLLMLAVTIHNIPEGLAVGVAFGAVAAGVPEASLAAAFALTLGIGLQNFPEGMVISMPLRASGMSSWKSFTYGQLSGSVELVSAIVGALAVYLMRPLLPYALAFAAGAMIFVVVEELIPEAQSSGDTDLATWGCLIGFALMMFLDVALG